MISNDERLIVTIIGKVIRGEGYGRRLGFPTANLDRRQFVRLPQKPRLGIWAGEARLQIADSRFKRGINLKSITLNLKSFPAAIVIGPIDRRGLPKIEAHLIGYRGNLYGQRIAVYLQKYVRPFKKFKNEDELKRQIGRDVKKVKRQKL